uniref:CSON010844 protein n=1 Tax=Culicoides sonorensis TaxID=179676 RepID=A0A336KMD4_CULSO
MMSQLIKILSILIVTSASDLIISINGQIVSSVVGSLCNKTAQCSSSCGKIIYCDGDKIPNEGVDCPASHPYCVTDVRADRCSNRPDPNNAACDDGQDSAADFFCTDIGYFPDPLNCRNYYICSYDPLTQDITPKLYTCPVNHIFNYANTKECYRYINPPASMCPNITCNGQASSYPIVHPRNRDYYYFCMPHPLKPDENRFLPIMFRCEEGWVFNGRKCVYDCSRRGNGRFSMSSSETNYYELSFLCATIQAQYCGNFPLKNVKCVSCTEFVICNGETQLGPKQSCHSTQRYCDSGKGNDFCSNTIDFNNLFCTTTQFKCTQPGYYPSPYNCREYFECYNIDTGGNEELIPQKRSCSDKQFYNSKTKLCTTLTSVAQCNTVSCNKDNVGFSPYKPDPQYYHFCTEDSSITDVVMLRCNDKETFTNAKGCRFHCPSIGRHAHEDKTRYYECRGLGVDNYDVENTKHCSGQLFDSFTAALLNIEPAAAEAETCKTDNFLECNAACDSFNFCNGAGSTPSGSQLCAAATPYCETTPTGAQCQATEGTVCKPAPLKSCTGIGYYPDLTNCSNYAVCGGDKTAPIITYTCPTGFYYSSKDTFCKKGLTCAKVTCPTTNSLVAPLAADPQYYYFCQPNKAPIVYKCKDNMEFKVGSGCTFVCPSEGRFNIDGKTYYFCYRDGTILKYSILACSETSTFDDTLKMCVGTPSEPETDPGTAPEGGI